VCAAAHAGRTHALTVIAWLCELLMATSFNRPSFWLTIFVSEFRQLRLPLTVEANAQRVNQNPDYYRQRQQITEHPFGTLKRQRGFTHALVRKKEKVLGEVGLMFIGYNLGRCVSILGVGYLIKALKECCLYHFSLLNWFIMSLFCQLKIAYCKKMQEATL